MRSWAGENRSGAGTVSVISYSAWRDRFGSDEEILGKTVQLDGQSATIVGVMDPAMEVGDIARAQFWVPLRLNPPDPSERRRLVVTGKLRPGATLEQAEEEMRAVHAGLRQRFPEVYAGWQPSLLDYDRFIVGEGLWAILLMLAITVGCVLLTACSNVATLMLARASLRSRELALRAALGAGRLQILRQLLTESLFIALAAGMMGLLLTRLSLEWMVWMVSESSGTTRFWPEFAPGLKSGRPLGSAVGSSPKRRPRLQFKSKDALRKNRKGRPGRAWW
ncbi:MAG: ABC transporter permease [Acidobacteriota bacterium]